MKKHKIIENVIPGFLQEKYIKDTKSFNWRYFTGTSLDNEGNINKQIETDEIFDVGQLVFKVCDENFLFNQQYEFKNLFPLIVRIEEEIFKEIEFKVIKCNRAKFNLLWRTKESNFRYNTPHVDEQQSNFISAVYYVNDSDGDTCLFYPNEIVRIKPKKGSLLIFPSNIKHTSSNPTKNYERIVINFVMKLIF